MSARNPMKDRRPPAAGSSRRPYRAPELVDYGPIARLTAGGSGVAMEGVVMITMTKRP